MCVGTVLLSTGYGRFNVMHFLGSLRVLVEIFRGRWRGEKSHRADVAVRDQVGFLSDVEHILKYLLLRDVCVGISALSVEVGVTLCQRSLIDR